MRVCISESSSSTRTLGSSSGAGEEVHLQPKTFELLDLLVRSRPKAISKQAIRAHLWPDVVVGDASLTMAVAELRAALGDDAKEPRFVRTVSPSATRSRARSSRSARSLGLERAGASAARAVGKTHHPARRRRKRPRPGPGRHRPDRRPRRLTATRAIQWSGTEATIEDLGSKNGTYVGDGGAPIGGSLRFPTAAGSASAACCRLPQLARGRLDHDRAPRLSRTPSLWRGVLTSAPAFFQVSLSREVPVIGRTLSTYRVVEKLGAGGMGEVYRARDEKLDRDVAVKVLPAGLLGDETARSRFRKEAKALSRFSHPHVATLLDFGSADGVDYLVMELVPGRTLTEALREGPLAGQGRRAPRDAARAGTGGRARAGDRPPGPEALEPLPDRGRALEDPGLRPGRSWLRRRPQTQETPTETAAGKVVGSPPYMSPEQLLGKDVDARSDVYSAGACLYELATVGGLTGSGAGRR